MLGHFVDHRSIGQQDEGPPAAIHQPQGDSDKNRSMVRALISAVIKLLANALGLVAAWALLPRFSINALSFVIAVVFFTVIEIIAEPFFRQLAFRYIPALMGGVALVSTLVGLVLTSLLSDGLHISGLGTWLVATLIVWLVGLLGGLLLPLFVLKKAAERHRKAS